MGHGTYHLDPTITSPFLLMFQTFFTPKAHKEKLGTPRTLQEHLGTRALEEHWCTRTLERHLGTQGVAHLGTRGTLFTKLEKNMSCKLAVRPVSLTK